MNEIESKMYALKKSGKRIIGVFPPYPPLELFHSMDLIPVVLWGLKKYFPKVDRSDKHIQSYSCSIARHLTEFVLSSAGSVLDGLYTYNVCDTFRNMPEVLTEAVNKAGRELPLFRMHIPMTSPELTDNSRYLKNEVGSLINNLETVFDVSFAGGRFKESIVLYEKQRRLAMDAEKKVSEGKLSFVDYVTVSENNLFQPVENQIESLEDLLQRDLGRNIAENGSRIVLSGILPPSSSIVGTMEEAGLRIVANDIASMYRSFAFTPEPTDSAEDYYVDFYTNHFPCPTVLHTAEKRSERLQEMLRKSGADGMVFIAEKFCELEYFEFPFLEKQLKNINAKTLLLEFSIDDHDTSGAYKTRIEAFAELLSA